jgi:uroporphyrinogen-III decarboxylase
MNADLLDWQLKVIDEICSICTPDFITFAEDMSYNHGPMLSKDLFEAFLTPYYQQVCPVLQDRGILPIIDSDGDVTAAIPWFAEAGLRGVLPLERQAGVDVVQLCRDFPEMCFIGGFNKICMNQGEAAIRAEFERLLPAASQGRLLISCDHQTPARFQPPRLPTLPETLP